MNPIAAIYQVVCTLLLAALAVTSCSAIRDRDSQIRELERNRGELELTLERYKSEANEREAKLNRDLAERTSAAREREQVLADTAEALQEQKDAQITSLARQRDDLRWRLRNATATTAATGACGVPGTAAPSAAAETATGGDAAELPGSTGHDLISEGYRAEVIRRQLEYCERQYDAARNR